MGCLGAGKDGNQEEEVRREEEESEQAGDGGERIPLEAMGCLPTNESRTQKNILNHYIKTNRMRKRKMTLMMIATIVFLTISMGLGVYIFTTQVICPNSPGHQDLTNGPINKDSAPLSISPTYNTQFPRPINQDSTPRISRWGEFLQRRYLQEQKNPKAEDEDLGWDQMAEIPLSQKPWGDIQPLPLSTAKESEELHSEQTPPETTPTQPKELLTGWWE